MRQLILIIAAIVLASCAEGGGQPHHRGGYGGGYGGMGMGGGHYSPARQMRSAGTAQADAILFAGFDRDGDLLISQAELESGIAREFARADANHDHVISPDEYAAWSLRALGGPYPPYRTEIDKNADGQITFDEFASELRDRAHSYDSNGDGVIEHADLVRGSSGADDIQLLTPQRGQPDGSDSEPRRQGY